MDCVNDKDYKTYLCYKMLDDIKTSSFFNAETVPNYSESGKELLLANYFYWFLIRYIKYQINEIYYKYLHTTIDELGQDIYVKYPAIINAFPDSLKKEKTYLLKLNNICENLIISCENGGGFEILEWLIDESKTGLFQLILAWAITNGIKNVIKKLKNFKTNAHIKQFIKDHKQDINEIMKYSTGEFNSEDDISSFIEEKTDIYRQQLIDILLKHNTKD